MEQQLARQQVDAKHAVAAAVAAMADKQASLLQDASAARDAQLQVRPACACELGTCAAVLPRHLLGTCAAPRGAQLRPAAAATSYL